MGEKELQMRVAIGGRGQTRPEPGLSADDESAIQRDKRGRCSRRTEQRKKQERITTVVCFAKMMGVRRRRRMIQRLQKSQRLSIRATVG